MYMYLDEFIGLAGSLRPATDRLIRRVGWPRNEWARMLQQVSLEMHPNANYMVHHVTHWDKSVREYYSK